MQTNTHVCSYLSQFFLEWEMFKTEFLEKIKMYFMFNNFFFFSEVMLLWDDVEKYCRAVQAKVANIIWRIRIAC